MSMHGVMGSLFPSPEFWPNPNVAKPKLSLMLGMALCSIVLVGIAYAALKYREGLKNKVVRKPELLGLSGLDPETVRPFWSKHEKSLRKLLDGSNYNLDQLPISEHNIGLIGSNTPSQEFDKMTSPIMLGSIPDYRGYTDPADPALFIRVSGHTESGEQKLVTVIRQMSGDLREYTPWKLNDLRSFTLFFDPRPEREQYNFGVFSEEAEGFVVLKQLICEGQVAFKGVTWVIV